MRNAEGLWYLHFETKNYIDFHFYHKLLQITLLLSLLFQYVVRRWDLSFWYMLSFGIKLLMEIALWKCHKCVEYIGVGIMTSQVSIGFKLHWTRIELFIGFKTNHHPVWMNILLELVSGSREIWQLNVPWPSGMANLSMASGKITKETGIKVKLLHPTPVSFITVLSEGVNENEL